MFIYLYFDVVVTKAINLLIQEEVVTLTMKKYRKAQHTLEEYERQAAEKSNSSPGPGNHHFVRSTRSMSVTRESPGIGKL